MKSIRTLLWTFALSGGCCLQAARPIAKEALQKSLERGGLAPAELADVVRTFGVGFALTAGDEAVLRKAGATDAVLEAVRASRVGASARSAGRPLEPVELLLKLFHATPTAAAAAVKVRGAAFDLTAALERQILEAGGDRSLLALVTLRRLDLQPTAAAPAREPEQAPGEPSPSPKASGAAGATFRGVRADPAAQAAKLVKRSEPEYPQMAQRAGIKGEVVLEVLIGRDGRVRRQRVVSGDTIFREAAAEAVKTYVYRPTTLDDQPVEVITEVTVSFGSAGSKARSEAGN